MIMMAYILESCYKDLCDLAQSQTYLLVIPDIEERVVGSEFSVAESLLAEMERSINRFAEGIPLLEERRFFPLSLRV